MAAATRAVTLPHGVVAEGHVDRTVTLRVPTGADEEHLLYPGATPLERANTLLERCVVYVGRRRASRELVRGLVCGDREALLLALRAAAFGDRVACVLDCPACGKAMDLDLSIPELLLPPYPDPGAEREVVLAAGRRVRFRLPTGDDLEVAARAGDVEEGVEALLGRCIVAAQSGRAKAHRLDPDERAELAAHMASLDPQAEIRLSLCCPECGTDFQALVDAASLLLDELAVRHDELYGEIHAIALRYHWSEAEILALDVPRRRLYLELLADAPTVRARA